METHAVNVGPRIVRAWFDTIVNPLIDALETEMRVIQDGNFTWRFRPAGFEYIRPIRQHIDPRFLANLEQIVTLYTDVDAAFRKHDECVESLLRGVQNLQGAITGNKEFQKLFEEAISAESLRRLDIASPTQIFGAYPKEDWIQVIAQYAINKSSELPFHYSTAKLWNAYRSQFIRMQQAPDIASHFTPFVALAGRLLQSDAALLDRLKDLRLDLSLTHDQPFVTAEPSRVAAVIRQAVIDTGPLFSAFVVNHVQQRPTQGNRDRLLGCVNESVQHPDTHARFLGLLGSISRKLTTSHVLGEINGLVKHRLKLHEPDLSRFWNGCIDLLTQWELDERLIQFLDFRRAFAPEITRVGIVDTGLIRLAQEHGCVLITEDEPLFRLAWEQGVDCQLLRSLL